MVVVAVAVVAVVVVVVVVVMVVMVPLRPPSPPCLPLRGVGGGEGAAVMMPLRPPLLPRLRLRGGGGGGPSRRSRAILGLSPPSRSWCKYIFSPYPVTHTATWAGLHLQRARAALHRA